MTISRFAWLEEQLEAEELAAKRFALYARLAKDPQLKEAFLLNQTRIRARCEEMYGELRACRIPQQEGMPH